MKYLYVGAMGEVDRAAAEGIREFVSAQFGVPARPLRLPRPDFAFDPRRRQYGSIPMLEKLTKQCPADALKVLAVTEGDLFIPVLTFVYGHAQLGGRVAVVSLARLRQEFYGFPPDPAALLARGLKEALHETGHTFGLVHCGDRACAMALSTNVGQIDSKHAALCASCAARLRQDPRVRI